MNVRSVNQINRLGQALFLRCNKNREIPVFTPGIELASVYFFVFAYCSGVNNIFQSTK
jgi:hypothetical protein